MRVAQPANKRFMFTSFGARHKTCRSRKMLKSVHMLWMVALAISVVSPNLSNAQDEHSQGQGPCFVLRKPRPGMKSSLTGGPRMAHCRKTADLPLAVEAAAATTIPWNHKVPSL